MNSATFEVPDATLYYEVRGSGPLVVLTAAPMDASSFEPLADLLATDHTVLTTDPRGIKRSSVADPERDTTPDDRADDLSRLLAHLDAGPALVLGSSGGAVSALALAQSHPEQVRAVVAHEPPFHALLPDRAERQAGMEDIIATYRAGDPGGAWVKFLSNADIALSEEEMAAMSPDADPDPRAAADERYSFLHMLRGTCEWEPDLHALRAAPVLIGLGETSTGELCDRVSRSLATALGQAPVMFPGGHLGFLEDPAAFAARLRAVM